MGTRITIKDEYGRKHEFFYKKVSKEINYTPQSRKTVECRLDVDVEKVEDIERIRLFLDNLEASMKSV
jgi:hypothetical protein